MSNFIYGPVPSRRLGRSLGLDIVVPKTCTVDCIYCQIGSVPPYPPKRKRFFEPELIEKELARAVEANDRIDYITFSGSGEPTLSLDIGRLIRFAKSLDVAPVCVLTNGTLLSDPVVREELSAADVVIPNLDAADSETFQAVNRPHKDIHYEDYLEGILKFKSEFHGALFLEIVLVKGVNDSDEHIHKLAERVREIEPDGVWIGTVSRPPAETWVEPVSDDTLRMARETIGKDSRVIDKFHGEAFVATHSDLMARILELLKRRPEKAEAIARSLGANVHETLKVIVALEDKKLIRRRDMAGDVYFEVAD